MADPDGLLDAVEVTEKIDDVFVAVAREFLVSVCVDVLNVHEQEVGGFHQTFDFSKRFACRPECDATRVDARVDSWTPAAFAASKNSIIKSICASGSPPLTVMPPSVPQ